MSAPQPAFRRPARHAECVDEPRRPRRTIAAGLPGHGAQRQLPAGRVADEARRLYGIQFHPEVVHTPTARACSPTSSSASAAAPATGTPATSSRRASRASATRWGRQGHVVCGLSGGVDSAVAAALMHRAIGDRLACVFVDHGLLRRGEAEQVIETFETSPGDAADRRGRQGGISHRPGRRRRPGGKRKLIGARFVRVFEARGGAAGGRVGRERARLSGAGHALPRRDRVGQQAKTRTRARSRRITTWAGCPKI
jgi:GMP synthase (glutamine-hydrolysing)